MLKATYKKYTLNFSEERGTSRGWLQTKDSWFISVWDENNPAIKGIGECSYLPGLNPEKLDTYEDKVKEVCEQINESDYWLDEGLIKFPSIHFGLETALLDLKNEGSKILFETKFSTKEEPTPINGLIWMGTHENMMRQVDEKIAQGFRCIKLKIGAIDFEKELKILKSIRDRSQTIEIRVDANGAFAPSEALEKLNRLAKCDLHSIEQPIKQGLPATMNQLCKESPFPIALDEELIGKYTLKQKAETLDAINPPYIILKPSLVGGIKGSREWIKLAEERGINWWITSALESNIGLNAIAQFVATTGNSMFQGLGTGKLYTNNIPSPLEVIGDEIKYLKNKNWDLSGL
ncbi:MAG: o-succinylbenzoate synthase [Flavobacteriales bacterium]